MGDKYHLNSTELITIARKAAQQLEAAPSLLEPGQQQALVAIVFSAAALEAFISEFAMLLGTASRAFPPGGASNPLANAAQLLDEIEAGKGQILLKYQAAMIALSGERFDRGAQPYQDFELLLRLRNAIVHMDAEPIKDTPHKTIGWLMTKNLCHRPKPPDEVNWVKHIATQATAFWAHNTAVAMVMWLSTVAAAKTPPGYQSMFTLLPAFFTASASPPPNPH